MVKEYWHGSVERVRGAATGERALQRCAQCLMDVLDEECHHGRGWKLELLKMGVSVVRFFSAGETEKHNNSIEGTYTGL